MKYATQEETERFERIAKQVGNEYGWKVNDIELVEFTEFKVQWTRCANSISFRISDYMCGAPDGVVADLIAHLFKMIEGHKSPGRYSDRMCKFLLSKSFAPSHRKTYLARKGASARKYTEFKGVPVHVLHRDKVMANIAGCSVLMNVIILNPQTLSESEEFIQNAIAREYNRIQVGLETYGKVGETVEYDSEVLRGLP